MTRRAIRDITSSIWNLRSTTHCRCLIFERTAPDLQVIFMQKVYSEAVLNTRHDVWDIHTNKDRWWVVTGGTNPYSQ
jgi:hypothetical protein